MGIVRRILDVPAFVDGMWGNYPPGHKVRVADGSDVFIRETPEPFPGAPVLLCYPGWTAPGGPNWGGLVRHASRHFRMIIIDNPGAGRTESDDPFTINRAAQNGIAVLDALGIEHAYLAGYSMGGPIASLHALLRPKQVLGLALCSTSNAFGTGFDVLYPFNVAAAVLSKLPREVLRLPVLPDLKDVPFGRAVEEFSRDSPVALIQAGGQLSKWNSASWLPKLKMPAAVVVTQLDGLVPAAHQRRMARLLPHSRIFTAWASHLTAPLGFGNWPATVTRALLDVQRRAERQQAHRQRRSAAAGERGELSA